MSYVNPSQTRRTLQLLNHIDHASHYLGGEINQVKKDLDRISLKMVLAFPDAYEIGMSHFGIQILYHILNKNQEVAAERVFAPTIQMENELRAHGLPLASLENKLPLRSFDIIGFSLLYELNYTNVLQMLDLAQIPFRANKRNSAHPLVIAGGPCCFNPEPVAEIFDAMVIGDGEEVINDMCEAWLRWNREAKPLKSELLKRWSRITGVYVPSFYEMAYQNGLLINTRGLEDAPLPVKRSVLSDLEKADFPEYPVVPFGKPVHDRLRLEVCRGCTRSCRFCQAGIIYRPVRERRLASLKSLTDRCLANTGYEDISLLSLSTGDYSQLGGIIKFIVEQHESQHVAVSLPSIRADRLEEGIMNLIKKARKTGFTIAPEAGSQRLRNIINKNISEDDIFKAVEGAFHLGWRIIKLYFMIGLPGETQADIDAIVGLVRKIKSHCQQNGFKGKINVSVATFVPKPHTPFQWEKQLDYDDSKEIIFYLKRQLNLPGIGFKWQQPQISRLEGLWARGDRRLYPLLEAAYEKGCRFDGWSDHFDERKWADSMNRTGTTFEDYLRSRALSETLPWGHIDSRVKTEFLLKERSRAFKQETTQDCREEKCHQCGICDFDKVSPILDKASTPAALNEKGKGVAETRSLKYQQVSLTYCKVGPARFFGHLEMINLITRALKRTNADLQFTQGFHPKAKMVFGDALPVGIESICEQLNIGIGSRVSLNRMKTTLNQNLPKGLRILSVLPMKKAEKKWQPTRTTYLVCHDKNIFEQEIITEFEKRNTLSVIKIGKKGRPSEIDLRKVVYVIELLQKNRIKVIVDQTDQRRIRPRFILQELFKLDRRTIEQTRMIKIKNEPIPKGG